jgi:hypothetical protein
MSLGRRDRRGAAGRPGRTGVLRRAGPILAALFALAVPAARGQSLSGFAELQAVSVDESVTTPGFPTVDTQTDSLRGRLNLAYAHQLWPNIQFLAGGLFEQLRGRYEVFGIETESDYTRLLPYALFRWQTPTNDAQLGWQRNEFRAGSVDRLVRDTYGITLGWTPEPTSYVRLSYYRSDDRDDTRTLLDRQTDRFLALASYRPIDPLVLDYRGAWTWEDDQANDTEIETISQGARVLYGDSFWNQRLMVSASYDVTWRQVQTNRGSPGEIAQPVAPIRGLAALSDMPANVTLAPNPALIDGNREVSTGVNLGVPRPSDDRSLRNIGFDFEIARAVNSIRVFVDRDLPLEISQTLTWEVWSSADNVRWTRQRTLGSAPFAPFDRYFELRFAAIAARYLKVVVAPLAPGVPNAQEYATLFVTELEAQLYRDVPGTGFEARSTEQRLYAGSQLVLTRNPLLTWDVNYTANIPDDGVITDTLANILSLSYRLNPIWLINARAGYETGRSFYGRRNSTLYGATLTATPLSTFSATLSASGQRDRYERGVDQNLDSLYLNTTTNLYDGVNLLLGGGVSRTVFMPDARIDGTPPDASPGTDITVNSETVSAALELLPNPTLSLYLGYDLTRDQRTGGALEAADTNLDSAEISLSWNPVPSFYFFGSYRIEHSSQLPDGRRLTTTSINWSPFPLGTVRFSLRYDEYYDTLLESQTRFWGPGLRWYLNPVSYLDVYWEKYDSESILSRNDRETLAATLRVGF